MFSLSDPHNPRDLDALADEIKDSADIRYSVKDLLKDLRDELRSINSQLALKADRDRVHDLANDVAAIRMEMAARASFVTEFREEQKRQLAQDEAIKSLEGFRNWVRGGLALAFVGIPVLVALLTLLLSQ